MGNNPEEFACDFCGYKNIVGDGTIVIVKEDDNQDRDPCICSQCLQTYVGAIARATKKPPYMVDMLKLNRTKSE